MNSNKLGISKLPLINTYKTKFHEDIFINSIIQGFYYSFNLYTSNIVIKNDTCSFLLYTENALKFSINNLIKDYHFNHYTSISYLCLPASIDYLSPYKPQHEYNNNSYSYNNNSNSLFDEEIIIKQNKSLNEVVSTDSLLFLSQFLSRLISGFIRKTKFEIKLANNKDQNIDILGKYITKEIIFTPYRFKWIFKEILNPRKRPVNRRRAKRNVKPTKSIKNYR